LRVVIGLGSNLGDRLGQLRAAVGELASRHDVAARSAVYETAPVGPPQPDYLNAAVRLELASTLDALFADLMSIERVSGRERTPENRWGARTLDLDILWAEGVVLATPTLTVPHPRLTERAFALCPLLDVAPDAVDPRTGERFVAPSDLAGVRRTVFRL
jgi:2-amino-4-hydroxy-6-hydroxymethyldihydropteridine diphosphokinase